MKASVIIEKHLQPSIDEKKPPQDLDELSNEWNGIPFTIDNETGKLIRAYIFMVVSYDYVRPPLNYKSVVIVAVFYSCAQTNNVKDLWTVLSYPRYIKIGAISFWHYISLSKARDKQIIS